MTAQRVPHRASALALAARTAMAALAALPGLALADEAADVAALVKPTSVIEIGLGYDAKGAAKFGEYNGLTSQGVDVIGNLLLRGGDAWGQGSGTTWWQLKGTDLGTSARNVSAQLVDQGHWRLGAEFDSLDHDYTNTYQTPLVGRMGGNTFLMPQGFGVVSTASAATPYGTQALTATQQAFFHAEDVHSDRRTTTLSGGFDFDEHWNVRLSLQHVNQLGAKLLSVGTDANVQAPGATLPGYEPGDEAPQVIMNPTSYTTDTLNAGLNWVGERAFATFTLVESHFVDNNSLVQFSNPYTPDKVPNGSLLGAAFPLDAISTMPSSNMYQVGLTAGYDFAGATRLVGSFSRSSSSQNQTYVNQDQMAPGGLPRNSLDGQVVTTHADLKLTNHALSHLTLGAALKYNERDNRTASAEYTFNNLGGEAQTPVNIPMSNRRTQAELTADWRVTSGQNLHLGYEYERIERWCRNALANNAQGELSDTNAGYYTVASCVQVPRSTENKLAASYRLQAGESVRLNLGLGWGDRKSHVNASFYNPMQADDEGFENFGYIAFFDASRQELSAKAGIDWQATEALDVALSGKVVRDNYLDSVLGVQHSRSASGNLDVTYEVSAKSSLSAFATWQRRTRDLLTANGRDAVAPLPNLWTNDFTDKATTLGFTGRLGGLAGGKVDLKASAVYSLGIIDQSTALQYTSAACTAPSNSGFNCGALPQIRSRLARFDLSGSYQLTRQSAVGLGYLFQKLDATDYFYNYYQLGFTGTTTMPTNQQSPTYTQNRVYVTYRYTFQ